VARDLLTPLALIAIGCALAVAARQDVRTREVDARVLAAAAAPAALLIYLNHGDPPYLASLALGLAIALAARLLGAGYADSIALAAVSAAPPVCSLPAAFIAVAAGSAALPAIMLRLYATNRRRPCRMTALEMLTHVCVSREELARSPLKYIVGSVRDVERYDPGSVRVDAEWVKAKYGVPYVLLIALGYWAYAAVYSALRLLP
jgi:preflagellin peptidase FlaK